MKIWILLDAFWHIEYNVCIEALKFDTLIRWLCTHKKSRWSKNCSQSGCFYLYICWCIGLFINHFSSLPTFCCILFHSIHIFITENYISGLLNCEFPLAHCFQDFYSTIDDTHVIGIYDSVYKCYKITEIMKPIYKES